MRILRLFSAITTLLVMASVPAFPAVTMVGGTFVTFDSTNSALLSNDILSICVDGAGRVWVGTDYGLTRFWASGDSSETDIPGGLSYSANKINALVSEQADAGQDIWVGTDGGVFKFSVPDDPDQFVTFDTYNKTSYPGMISNKITSVAVDSQHVRWFGSDLGLMSFDGTTWKAYTTDSTGVKLADNYINAIAYEETSYGPEIWVGTNNGISVIKTTIDAMSFATPYRTTNSSYPGMVSDRILAAAVDTVNNARWFGSDRGLIKFQNNAFTSYTIYDFLPDSCVTSVAFNSVNELLYAGTQIAGYVEYDAVSTATTVDIDWSGLASNNIRAIAVGRTGVLWIGTDKGVTKWIPEGISDDTSSVAEEAAAWPVAIKFESIYPNPFNPSTTIEFSLEKPGYAVLAVYNLSGQLVRQIEAGLLSAGTHSAIWDGKDRNGLPVSSGAYFAHLRYGNVVVNRKMLLLK